MMLIHLAAIWLLLNALFVVAMVPVK